MPFKKVYLFWLEVCDAPYIFDPIKYILFILNQFQQRNQTRAVHVSDCGNVN